MKVLTGIVVVAFALFLIGLAATSFTRPSLAMRFLNAHASSATAHYAEQAVRLAVGGSLVAFSSEMWQPDVFRLFGWVVVVTTVGLLGIPWRWHQRFARRVVPPVTRHMTLYGLGAAALGVLVLLGASL